MDRHRNLLKATLVIALVVLLFVAAYSAIKLVTEFLIPKYDLQDDLPFGIIEVDGIKYSLRDDVSTFLLMGIDKSGPVTPSDSYNNDGASDVVSVIVFDDSAKTYKVLMLNRDTMLDVNVLSVTGTDAGSVYGQLALAHTYGTGVEDSCRNVKKTVVDFLGDIEIDYYLSMRMDAVSVLTDAIGGVKVNVTDDFSDIDPEIKMGENILNGKTALSFVRNRQGVGDQLNLSRMERQKIFISAFLDTVSQKYKNDDSFAMKTYNSIAKYVVSDCPVSTFDNIIEKCMDYKFEGIVSPEGKNEQGEKYMEFYADKDSVKSLVLQLFYQQK